MPRWAINALCVVALGCFVYPWISQDVPHFDHPWMPHLLFAAMGLVALVTALQNATFRLFLYPDRVEKRTLFGTQSVHFADVERVTLELQSTQESDNGMEILRLNYGGHALVLTPMFPEYVEVRETLIKRCAHARYKDYRPDRYRKKTIKRELPRPKPRRR